MENRVFLQALDLPEVPYRGKEKSLLTHQVTKYIADRPFPDIASYPIAIIGVEESRYAANNPIAPGGPDMVRHYLYQLNQGPFKLSMADLGNIKSGQSVEDTYAALAEVLVELIENKVVPVVIGGSQDLTFGIYKAYEKLKRIINIVAVDKQFDLGDDETKLSSETYLKKIILQQPNYLFNYSNIGYQSYFVDQQAIKLMENMFFDVIRLGMARAGLPEVEPVIRNADVLSFDVGAIRASDAPGHAQAGPNGFFVTKPARLRAMQGFPKNYHPLVFLNITRLTIPGVSPHSSLPK